MMNNQDRVELNSKGRRKAAIARNEESGRRFFISFFSIVNLQNSAQKKNLKKWSDPATSLSFHLQGGIKVIRKMSSLDRPVGVERVRKKSGSKAKAFPENPEPFRSAGDLR